MTWQVKSFMISDLATVIEFKTQYWSSFLDYDDPIVRESFSLSSDGILTICEYHGKKKKLHSKRTIETDKDLFKKLADRVITVITHADRFETFLDDRSEELNIYFPGGKISVDRGISNNKCSVGDIMHEFFDSIV